MNIDKLLTKFQNSFYHADLAGNERIVVLLIIQVISCFVDLKVRVVPGSHFPFLGHKTIIQTSLELFYFTKYSFIATEERMDDVQSLGKS